MIIDEVLTHSGPFAVLSSMVTPAVLIAVCASLSLGTAQRLNRVIERTRKLFEQYKEQKKPAQNAGEVEKNDIEQLMLDKMIEMQTGRVQYLQKAVTSIYLAMGFFVSTCIAIGVVQIGKFDIAWLPLTIGMFGAFLLFYACILIIMETNIALEIVNIEMSFIRRILFTPNKAFSMKEKSFLRRLWYR
jgi:hypothetical protein